MKISNILASKGVKVITIRPEQTLRDAVALLSQHNIGALVVVNASGAPVGILSERDIVRGLASRDNVLALSVDGFMTRDLVTGSPHDDLGSVLRTMTDRRFRHLPIIDDGRLAGIVSIGDVVKAQLNEYQGEIATLETRITQG